MKYGTIDLDLFEFIEPWFGDQAEVVSLSPLTSDGRRVRAVVKSTGEHLPGGADSQTGELPQYSVEFTQAPQVKFTRQS